MKWVSKHRLLFFLVILAELEWRAFVRGTPFLDDLRIPKIAWMLTTKTKEE